MCVQNMPVLQVKKILILSYTMLKFCDKISTILFRSTVKIFNFNHNYNLTQLYGHYDNIYLYFFAFEEEPLLDSSFSLSSLKLLCHGGARCR